MKVSAYVYFIVGLGLGFYLLSLYLRKISCSEILDYCDIYIFEQ